MILTSHRLDCFSTAIEFLADGGSLYRFDVVAILCSGVKGRHLRYIESLPLRYPSVKWEFIHGPRGRGKPISDLQNQCVRNYPDSLYFKLDEDTFVSRDWDIKMTEAYEAFKHDNCLSLISAVVTNNQRGAYFLMNLFPEIGEEFTRRFNQPIINERMGPIWLYPQCAEFMIRRFLNLDRANEELRRRLETRDLSAETVDHRPQTIDQKKDHEKSKSTVYGLQSTVSPPPSTVYGLKSSYQTFSYPFSINCICYDYRHWLEIGGVPEQDENGWGIWIPANGKFVVLTTEALVHHYSFFVQQDWLDRLTLLEDIRNANLIQKTSWFSGKCSQCMRIVRQIPSIIMRRIKKTNR